MIHKLSDDQMKWFNNLWHSNANQYDFYELAQSIKPELTKEEWDYAWQWTTILNDNYPIAIREFLIATNGTY